jgi:hypothetical protein
MVGGVVVTRSGVFLNVWVLVCDTSRQGKFLKLLRIEMENYPIIMTMGM